MATAVACSQIQYVVTDSIDYTGNITATDRSKYNTQTPAHPTVEVQSGYTYPAVSVRGDDPSVTVNLLDTTGQSYSANFVVTAARYVTLNSVTHTVTVSPSSQAVAVNAFPNDTQVNLTVSGIPDEVSGGRLEVIGYLELTQTVTIGFTQYQAGYKFWGNSTNYQDMGDLLCTEDTPLGFQTMPWTDLLTIVCDWAEGCVGATTVMSEVTYTLYWDTDFYYDPTEPYYCDEPDEDNEYLFMLRKWIIEHYQSGGDPVDCKDVASFLFTAGESLGISGYVRAYDAPGLFVTNPVCGIGSNATTWSAGTYLQHEFDFHIVYETAYGVFDGALAQWKDLSGSLYREPAMGWDIAGFRQTSSSWTSPANLPYNGGTNSSWARLGLAFGIVTQQDPLTWQEQAVGVETAPIGLIGYTQ